MVTNDKITDAWKSKFCRDIFSANAAGRMNSMIQGSIDGYLAQTGLYEKEVRLSSLWESAIYFCSDNGYEERPNNDQTRSEIVDYLLKTYPAHGWEVTRESSA